MTTVKPSRIPDHITWTVISAQVVPVIYSMFRFWRKTMTETMSNTTWKLYTYTVLFLIQWQFVPTKELKQKQCNLHRAPWLYPWGRIAEQHLSRFHLDIRTLNRRHTPWFLNLFAKNSLSDFLTWIAHRWLLLYFQFIVILRKSFI